MAMLRQLTLPPLNPPPMLSQRITASVSRLTKLSWPRRRQLLAPVSQRPASQTRAASKTRSGQMPRLSPRKRKRTSLPPLLERPSVSVSARLSKPSTLTNVSSRLLSVEDVEVDSAAAVVVAMELPEVDEVISEDVAKAVDAVDVVMVLPEEVAVVLLHEEATLLPSTPTTPALFPA